MLISFIIPVFNTKLTLNNCVESIFNQHLDDASFEIILVNDGSTDGSDELCQNLANHSQAIRVINQKNQGVSSARNCGLRAARGEYLCFIDSDDNLISNELSALLPNCDGKTDLVRFWCKMNGSGNTNTLPAGDGSITFSGSGRDYLCWFGLETFCVNYLYRKAFLIENHLLFSSGIIGEDYLFMFDVMMANPYIVSIARQVYQYNITPNSISTCRTPEHSRKWVKDLMGTLSGIIQDIEPLRISDPFLYEKCRSSVDVKALALFSRMLSSRYSVGEFREILSSCRATGLLPQQLQTNTSVYLLSHVPILYPLASQLFCHIFLPYIYPKLNRNCH